MQPETVLVLCGCLAVGMAQGLLAALKAEAARRPERSLLTALDFAALGLLLVAAVGVDFFGLWAGVSAGSILLGAALFGLAVLPPSRGSWPLLAAAGLGAAALFLALLPLMPHGLLGDREAVASVLFGTVFIALGALIAGPLLDVLRAAAGYRLAMTLLGLVSFAPAVVAALTPHASFPAQPAFEPRAVFTAKLGLAGLVFAFYGPLEAFVSVWVTTYLAGQARPAPSDAITAEPAAPRDDGQAGQWLGWFWLAFLGSRVLAGCLLHVSAFRDEWQPSFLVVPALLAAVVLGNLSGSTSTRQALSGVILLGFVLGPVVPVLLAILGGMRREAGGAALAVALLHVAGAAGGVILSPLVTSSAEGRTAQAALRLPLFMALLMAAAAILFSLTAER